MSKWQPIVLVLKDERRLECQCGNLAVFVTGVVADDEYNNLDRVDCWCQECFTKAQEEDEDL